MFGGPKSNISRQILYGVPLPPSQVQRLAFLGKKLEAKSISVLVDHPSQLHAVKDFKHIAGFSLRLLVKVDTGYHRAGLSVGSAGFDHLIKEIYRLESYGIVEFTGLYSHTGHSYGGDSESTAMNLLIEEIEGLEVAANQATVYCTEEFSKSPPRYILSVGATPTATSVQTLLMEHYQGSLKKEISKLKGLIERVSVGYELELHAGVYSFLDMQQLATQASPSAATGHLAKMTLACRLLMWR